MNRLFEQAIAFSVNAHRGMTRKDGVTPYILHPLEVAVIAGTITADPEVLAAAVLHDTVEDTDTTMEELKEKFGGRVADLVASETEEKYRSRPAAETWRQRKQESLVKLSDADDPGVHILWLGDKLSNMRSFYRDYGTKGNRLWERFNQKDPVEQAWYYRTIELLLEPLRDTAAWQEYHRLVQTVFQNI